MSLYELKQEGEYHIHSLVTSVNAQYQRISMHGVRVSLLQEQAKSLGLPLHLLMVPEMPTMESYNALMLETMTGFKAQGVDYAVFGDIFLEDLKKYREEQLAKVQIKGVFPIWKKSSTDLVRRFIDLGFKAVLVCVDERHLDQSFAGRAIDDQLLKDLPKGVDPCGENGEYHSFVYDGPIFRRPIAFTKGDVVHRTYADPSGKKVETGFWYCDLLPCA